MLNKFDLLLYGAPDWAWWIALFISGSILIPALSMVAIRVWCSSAWGLLTSKLARLLSVVGVQATGGNNLVPLAYRAPQLVRISQSPVWTGVLLLAMGLIYVEAGARWPSMDARVYGELHRAWVAKSTGDLTTDLLREIQRSQAPWAALRDNQVATLGSWAPNADLSSRENARKASFQVARAHFSEVLGIALVVIGALVILVML